MKRAQVNDEGVHAAGRAPELAKNGPPMSRPNLRHLLGDVELYLFAGNDRAAVEDAKRAFLLNPKDVGNVLTFPRQTSLAEVKIEAGIATLEQALELEARPDVHFMLSQALRGRGNAADVRRSVELLEGLHLP